MTLPWEASLNNRYRGFETLDLINTTMDMSSADPTAFDNIRNQAGSTLSLADNTIIINGDYFQTIGSVLELSAQTNLSINPRIDANDVTFQSGSLISFTGSSSDFAINNRYTNLIASASSTLSIDDSSTLFAGSLLDVKDAYELNNNLYAIFDRRSLTNSATGFDVIAGSKSANILNEIDNLATPDAVKMTDAIFSSEFTPTLEDLNNSNIYLKDFDIRYNKIRHQFKNSECGVYSMNFIIRLLNGESFNAITQNITKDDDMNECRKVYFNNIND